MKKALIQNHKTTAERARSETLFLKPWFAALQVQGKRSLNISGTTSKARFIYIFAASNQVRESLAKEGKSGNLVYTNMKPRLLEPILTTGSSSASWVSTCLSFWEIRAHNGSVGCCCCCYYMHEWMKTRKGGVSHKQLLLSVKLKQQRKVI